MFRLRLLNVDRIVDNEKDKNNLISKGFKLIEEIKEKAEEIETKKGKGK